MEMEMKVEMEVEVEGRRQESKDCKRKRCRREKKSIRRFEPTISPEEEEWADEEEADKERWLSNSQYWERYINSCFGPAKDTTSVHPMRYVEGPIPAYATSDHALQIFSVQVTEVKHDIDWPLHVYGCVATRDSVDPKRNILFYRGRDNCQVLTKQDSYLQLTGPSRAVVLIDPVWFEAELKVKMEKESEDKILSLKYFYHHMTPVSGDKPRMLSTFCSSTRSTIEFTYAVFYDTVEATVVNVQVTDGSWPDHLRVQVVCRTTSIVEGDIVLLDAKDGRMPITCGGAIELSRNVVSVDVRDQLNVDVVVLPIGENSVPTAKATAVFTPEKAGIRHGICNLGFCKVQITVGWSLLATWRDMMTESGLESSNQTSFTPGS